MDVPPTPFMNPKEILAWPRRDGHSFVAPLDLAIVTIDRELNG